MEASLRASNVSAQRRVTLASTTTGRGRQGLNYFARTSSDWSKGFGSSRILNTFRLPSHYTTPTRTRAQALPRRRSAHQATRRSQHPILLSRQVRPAYMPLMASLQLRSAQILPPRPTPPGVIFR